AAVGAWLTSPGTSGKTPRIRRRPRSFSESQRFGQGPTPYLPFFLVQDSDQPSDLSALDTFHRAKDLRRSDFTRQPIHRRPFSLERCAAIIVASTRACRASCRKSLARLAPECRGFLCFFCSRAPHPSFCFPPPPPWAPNCGTSRPRPPQRPSTSRKLAPGRIE